MPETGVCRPRWMKWSVSSQRSWFPTLATERSREDGAREFRFCADVETRSKDLRLLFTNPIHNRHLIAENPDQARRQENYVESQKIPAQDLPAINLWYRDTVIVHNKRLTNIEPTPSGSYSFLETAELAE
jgi:hypothetical protein